VHNPVNTLISFGLLISVVGGSFYYVYATAPIKPWTGISAGVTITPDAAEMLGLERDHGFLIILIAPSSPADRAGLRGGSGDNTVLINGQQVSVDGDIIVSMDGREINQLADSCAVLAQKEVGDSVRFEVSRDGSLQQANVILEELPPGERTAC
jgi:S1-C subfamily serine protease